MRLTSPLHSLLQKSYDALMTEMLSLRQPLAPEYLPSAGSTPPRHPLPDHVSRVPVLQQLLELRGRRVGVALRSSNGAVSQKRLDEADVHVVLEQERREGVSEHVGRDVCSHARLVRALLDDLAYSLL